jgi:hypothetical protein
MSGTASVRAGDDLVLQVGTGQVDLRGHTTLTAGADLQLTVGTGDVRLSDWATLLAADVVRLDITDQGGLVMADAETLIEAGRSVVIRTVDDIRLDLIRAGDSVTLTSTLGAILDNTAAEDDLIVTPLLTLTAAHGIGVPWKDNLNVDVQVLNALNTTSGGINVQNRHGFRVGSLGVTNLGNQDVVLTAGGDIEQSGLLYQNASGGANTVSNRPGQRIYVLSNLSERDLAEQWGNASAELTSVLTARPEQLDLRSLLGDLAGSNQIHDQLMDLKDEDWLLQRPIQLAQQALLGDPGDILASLGLRHPDDSSATLAPWWATAEPEHAAQIGQIVGRATLGKDQPEDDLDAAWIDFCSKSDVAAQVCFVQ